MFSVVIPVYNHQQYLVSSVLSAMQSPLVTEILIVDDGSGDRSAEVIDRLAAIHPKIRVLRDSPGQNLGAHVRINSLVRQARNEWVAVLNSDDEFVPGRFEVIERNASQGITEFFFGDLIVIDEAGDRVGQRRAITDNEYPWLNPFDAVEAAADGRWTELLLQQNVVATTTNMVFKKSLFERVEGFRAYRYCHDWDFALRATLCGTVTYSPLLMSRYRVHPGNTIREQRANVEREVRSMIAGMYQDYPHLTRSVEFQSASLNNRYVHPTRSTWLEIVRSSDPIAGIAEASLQETGMDVRFIDSPSRGKHAGTYLYAPRKGLGDLSANDLRNIRLSVAVRPYDVYLISRCLEPYPATASKSARDLILYNRNWVSNDLRAATARLMRLLPARISPGALRDLIGDSPFSIDHAFSDAAADGRHWSSPLPLTDESLGPRPIKPVIFIFPIFLAVGGAERLVVETVRLLSGKYHFVIVNTEPLLAQHGSMHEEALLYAQIYDLAETVRQDDRLNAIDILKRHYDPQLVWITNGSPWQIAHARELRAIFSDIPIVDNQAYDHKEGWINAFSDPHVRSADRYIAINEKIRTAMIGRFGIAESIVDLVYHGAKISHLGIELADRQDVRGLRERLGLPREGLLFGMIGRLTSQKRPWDLVHLAARVAALGETHQFFWAGPGEMRNEIERLRNELKADNFFLLPPTPDVQSLYEVLDGLVVTSEFEGLPFVVLEALAMGVPVLSTPVGAIEEVLTFFGSGRIGGAPGNLDALETAFSQFVAELGEIKAVARSRRLEFIEKFSSERMANEYDASWTRAMVAFA